MDVKKLIIQHVLRRGEVRTSDVVKETGFSRAYVNRFMQELVRAGSIALIGKANRARYVPRTRKIEEQALMLIVSFRRVFKNANLMEDEVLAGMKQTTGIFSRLPNNIGAILDYAFTEMLNNAIEHSRSARIEVRAHRSPSDVRFEVIDRGIGIFASIAKKKNLPTELEAIRELLKGKQTTAPETHTGEGIFFTSKAADMLTIQSSRKKLIFNASARDVFIRDIKKRKGTKVSFGIALQSKTLLPAIFRKYAGDAFRFDTTEVLVKLYQIDTSFISRSQARRVVSGLEKFKTVVLDFLDVETVGQAFADEVFRVWGNSHSHSEVRYRNANENIEFMIRRALAE
ncbi:MAG: DUF4325 domain-containing protein [bacterium]|nr:DUF4325 domain-containing protein [bacterium]